MPKKKTTEEFIEQAKNVHVDKLENKIKKLVNICIG